MRYLKKYNEEVMFDSSTIEDILLEVTDEGHTWDINIGKSSEGKSNITVCINFTHKVEWDKINPCVIRVYEYLSKEGYIPSGYTEDKIDQIENDNFEPEEWITGYDRFLFELGEGVKISPVTLELIFKK